MSHQLFFFLDLYVAFLTILLDFWLCFQWLTVLVVNMLIWSGEARGQMESERLGSDKIDYRDCDIGSELKHLLSLIFCDRICCFCCSQTEVWSVPWWFQKPVHCPVTFASYLASNTIITRHEWNKEKKSSHPCRNLLRLFFFNLGEWVKKISTTFTPLP